MCCDGFAINTATHQKEVAPSADTAQWEGTMIGALLAQNDTGISRGCTHPPATDKTIITAKESCSWSLSSMNSDDNLDNLRVVPLCMQRKHVENVDRPLPPPQLSVVAGAQTCLPGQPINRSYNSSLVQSGNMQVVKHRPAKDVCIEDLEEKGEVLFENI